MHTHTHMNAHHTPRPVRFIICKALSPSQLQWSGEESSILLNCSIFSAQTGLLRERFKGFLISLLTERHKGKEDYMAFKFYFVTNLAPLDKPFHFLTFLCLPNWDNDTDLHASDRGINEPWLINNCEIIAKISGQWDQPPLLQGKEKGETWRPEPRGSNCWDHRPRRAGLEWSLLFLVKSVYW